MTVPPPDAGPAPELSRPVVVDRLPPEGRTLAVVATEAECAALAARFGLDALESLTGTAVVRPLGGRRRAPLYGVDATVTARVRQTCVVTLDSLVREITETVCQRFVGSDSAKGPDRGSAVDVDPEAVLDPPEPIVAGCIDVGEVLAEGLGLAIDPHPRADDAVFTPPPDGTIGEEAGGVEPDTAPDQASGPFAALAALR
ncbi:DUF177 domain-containing protein [Roseospira visakhapatnamensis]|uniref:DUF177 domain-containing protein n=1 Tax=Roseospira visakhapatnamensis TaxID=390880 RepID=A0A7W6WAZ1_9PROT|nr:DUF177 domain-containing protein [Roseospira visakhapatnamensis]MBB4266991.1 hypothetical protein [Roseospira visakhapatnamensis]